MAENVRQRLHHELNELEKRAQLRALDTLEGVNLCSNDYFELSNDPRLRQAVENVVGSAAAVASTGSRLLPVCGCSRSQPQDFSIGARL